MADTEELLARIASLEDSLRVLQDELAGHRRGGFHSMAQHRRCPACGNPHLLFVRLATHVNYGSVQALGIVNTQSYLRAPKTFGPLAYFVCRRCHLAELHVSNLEKVEVDGKLVLAIDPPAEPSAPPSDGPFR